MAEKYFGAQVTEIAGQPRKIKVLGNRQDGTGHRNYVLITEMQPGQGGIVSGGEINFSMVRRAVQFARLFGIQELIRGAK